MKLKNEECATVLPSCQSATTYEYEYQEEEKVITSRQTVKY